MLDPRRIDREVDAERVEPDEGVGERLHREQPAGKPHEAPLLAGIDAEERSRVPGARGLDLDDREHHPLRVRHRDDEVRLVGTDAEVAGEDPMPMPTEPTRGESLAERGVAGGFLAGRARRRARILATAGERRLHRAEQPLPEPSRKVVAHGSDAGTPVGWAWRRIRVIRSSEVSLA